MPVPSWVLPLGISFYVFEGISYTVDTIRQTRANSFLLGLSALYRVLSQADRRTDHAGQELLPQIEHPPTQLASGTILDGCWLLITGLFLKIVLADGISVQIDDAFSRKYQTMGSTDAWLMAVAFGLQIYLDFSSYSRMAIGSARLLGIQLVDNFNYPYSATSPVDFWNRLAHVVVAVDSRLFVLSAGRQKGHARSHVPGHPDLDDAGAASGTGLAGRLCCGLLSRRVLIAGYHVLTYRRRIAPPSAPTVEGPLATRVWHLSAMCITFGLVSLGWLFFRSSSMPQALGLFSRALMPWAYMTRSLNGTFYMHAALLVLAVWAAPVAARLAGKVVGSYQRAIYCVLEGGLIGAMIVLCMIYLRGQTAFIYFQF